MTVNDLLKLPSLREATVAGGRGGLSRAVSSISVLESVDPGLLVDGLFSNNEFYGSEIVITGFLNMLDNVDLQYENMLRLVEGGEVGLI
ncbi:MAG: PucR family transcriptional regulator ligand-binding domain-containing protein, partial [Eubacteriaceae bacterium]